MKLTIKDIARLAETSATAVSFVLNGKDEGRVSAEKREAILAVVRKVGYRRSAAAKGLTLNRSYRIAVCTAGGFLSHPLIGATSHHELINLASQRLHDAGYGIAPVQADVHRSAAEITGRLRQVEADGFLFVDMPADVLDRILFSMSERHTPAVALGTSFPETAPGYSWAAIDRGGSFEQATAHLLDRGLRRIAMLDIDVSGTFTAVKRAGYERAMRARGLEPLPLLGMARRTARAAQAATRELLAAVPEVEGILLTDNLFASVVQLALNGRPVELLGFGDDTFARLCDPPLSFMRLPVAALAEVCVAHLLSWIDAPETHEPLRRSLLCDLVLQEEMR